MEVVGWSHARWAAVPCHGISVALCIAVMRVLTDMTVGSAGQSRVVEVQLGSARVESIGSGSALDFGPGASKSNPSMAVRIVETPCSIFQAILTDER